MKRSFTFVLLLVVCLLCIGPLAAQDAPTPEPVGLRPDAPQYALHGPYWVGTKEFEAETDSHATTVQLWYPALNSDGEDEDFRYSDAVTVQGNAILNAEPDTSNGPYPLVIFAHGSFSTRFSSAYLAEHLASQGFVVMAIEHEDNLRTSNTVNGLLTLHSRPADVAWEIDLAEELTTTGDEALGGLIDTDRIAVVGYSWGGTTALFAGGARADYNGPTSFCVLYPDLIFPGETGPNTAICKEQSEGVAERLGWDAVPEGLWPSWGDARLDAVVALAPDISNYGAESLSGVTAPTLIMAGSQDTWILSDMPEYKPYLYDNLGSDSKALILFDNADHMIFNSDCEAIPWIVQYGLNLCSDAVWDMDRAHDLINHFTTAFLLSTLKGDAEATAALSPDAVAFPGIAYQAEGF